MANTVNVEIATSDGLARYQITGTDLFKVPAEHQAQVASALGVTNQPPAAPEPSESESAAPEPSEAEPTTPTPAPKRVKE